MDWLIASIPGLPPTVSWVEAGWFLASLIPIWFGILAAQRWCRVQKAVDQDAEAGVAARGLAGMLLWMSRGMIAMAVVNLVIVVPSLFTPPPPDIETNDTRLASAIIVPTGLIANNLILVAMAVLLGHGSATIARQAATRSVMDLAGSTGEGESDTAGKSWPPPVPPEGESL